MYKIYDESSTTVLMISKSADIAIAALLLGAVVVGKSGKILTLSMFGVT